MQRESHHFLDLRLHHRTDILLLRLCMIDFKHPYPTRPKPHCYAFAHSRTCAYTQTGTQKSTYYTSIRALIPCEQTAPEISVSSASCPTVIHQMLWAQNACLILSLRATAMAVVVLPTPPMPLGPNRPRLPSLSNDERQSK